jgi:hypothetical protein
MHRAFGHKDGGVHPIKFTLFLVFAIFSFCYWCVRGFAVDTRRMERKRRRYEERYGENYRDEESRSP